MIFAALVVASFVASLASAAPTVGGLPIVTLPISKNPRPFTFSSLVKERTFLQSKTGSAAAINEEVSYVVQCTIGNEVYDLILDTGSSNTWVGANKPYKVTPTSHPTGDTFKVSYGSGVTSGMAYVDKFQLGGLTVQKQVIGVANRTSGFSGVDGIFVVGPVGLTRNTVSNMALVPTVLDNLYKSKNIWYEALGVYFKPLTGNATKQTNGEITLGGADPSKHTGHITYVPITKVATYSTYWGIDVSDVSYGTKSLLKSAAAIVDTGTTLMYIPQNAYYSFLKSTKGSNDPSGLPVWGKAPTENFVFTIGRTKFTLTPKQYLVPRDQYAYFNLDTTRYFGWISTLGPVATGDVDFILGQKFLEHFYSIFDTTNHRVGLSVAR